jgi:hypothetical protein
MTKTNAEKMEITVTLQQVLEAIQMIFSRAEANGLRAVTVSHDWYWHINPDKAFDLSEPPPELFVGDLYDDAEVVRDIERIKDGLIGLHLTHIASLLDYIGSEYPSLTPFPRERLSLEKNKQEQ